MINTDDKLSDDIIFKRAAILMTCAIKDATKSHPELFLYHALYEEKTQTKRKAFKKHIIKELMPVGEHPIQWWDLCMSEDGKKGIEAVFTDKNYYRSW